VGAASDPNAWHPGPVSYPQPKLSPLCSAVKTRTYNQSINSPGRSSVPCLEVPFRVLLSAAIELSFRPVLSW
jgi:hypothetical protein